MLKRLACLSVLLSSVLMLGACVTTSTGGFNVDVSEESAFEDYLQLSLGYLEEGDLVNAKRHLNNAQNIHPNNSEMHGIWGLVYAREGDLELADRSFRRALRQDASNSQTRNNYAAFLFSNARYEETYEQLERVVEDTTYRARPQAFENLGLAALRLGRQEDAIYAFTRAVQLNNNQVRSIIELIELHLAKNDINVAMDYYRNYQTLLQFYRLNHTARSLWQGIRLELISGNLAQVEQLGQQLSTLYPESLEAQLFNQSQLFNQPQSGDSSND